MRNENIKAPSITEYIYNVCSPYYGCYGDEARETFLYKGKSSYTHELYTALATYTVEHKFLPVRRLKFKNLEASSFIFAFVK